MFYKHGGFIYHFDLQDMQNTLMPDENLISACRDYFYLMDRGFPEKGTLKLIGDRYRLSGDERTVLYRGISSRERSHLRRMMIVQEAAGRRLMVDGYNVLFTLLNYRLGRVMFVSTDNILRDAGAFHGRIRNESLFGECMELMLGFMPQLAPASVHVYLDSPVSHSEKHADAIRALMGKYEFKGECQVVKSADWVLKNNHDGIISTSDTVVIEKSGLPVLDLPRTILEHNFGATFVQLLGLIGKNP